MLKEIINREKATRVSPNPEKSRGSLNFFAHSVVLPRITITTYVCMYYMYEYIVACPRSRLESDCVCVCVRDIFSET